MKVKDTTGSLGNRKVKTPKGIVGYWKSQWAKGVWLTDGKTRRIYPQFIDKLEDTLKWEIDVEDEVNCDIYTRVGYIDNTKT